MTKGRDWDRVMLMMLMMLVEWDCSVGVATVAGVKMGERKCLK